MAEALKIGIGYLLAKFPANAFKILRALYAAWAVAARAPETLFDGFNYLFIRIQLYGHGKQHLSKSFLIAAEKFARAL